MIITVFGASGGIGGQVAALAARRGHHVRAVYRTPPDTPPPGPPGQAKVFVIPDIFDAADAAEAVRGTDVVVGALGPNFATRHNPRTTMTSPPDLHQRLARTLVTAIRQATPQARLICVSTASMGPADNVMGPGARLLFGFFRTVVVPNLGRVGQDLRAMECELAASGLDWYAPRPVKLTDGPHTGSVQASDRFRMKTISRADVAWHILALAEDPAPGPQRTPVITTGTSRTPRAAGTQGRDLPTRQAPAAS
jgi:NAD(P)-dependent dehydrogenase (short-subunit alcohol dehydrogenase family)